MMFSRSIRGGTMPNAHSVTFATTATALGSGGATDSTSAAFEAGVCYGFLTAPTIGSHYTERTLVFTFSDSANLHAPLLDVAF
jgi:hypothetical protein